MTLIIAYYDPFLYLGCLSSPTANHQGPNWLLLRSKKVTKPRFSGSHAWKSTNIFSLLMVVGFMVMNPMGSNPHENHLTQNKPKTNTRGLVWVYPDLLAFYGKLVGQYTSAMDDTKISKKKITNQDF